MSRLASAAVAVLVVTVSSGCGAGHSGPDPRAVASSSSASAAAQRARLQAWMMRERPLVASAARFPAAMNLTTTESPEQVDALDARCRDTHSAVAGLDAAPLPGTTVARLRSDLTQLAAFCDLYTGVLAYYAPVARQDDQGEKSYTIPYGGTETYQGATLTCDHRPTCRTVDPAKLEKAAPLVRPLAAATGRLAADVGRAHVFAGAGWAEVFTQAARYYSADGANVAQRAAALATGSGAAFDRSSAAYYATVPALKKAVAALVARYRLAPAAVQKAVVDDDPVTQLGHYRSQQLASDATAALAALGG